MADEPREISNFDARLAEIDRRLNLIQTGLAADLEDEAGVEPPAPAPPAAMPPAAVGPAPEPRAAEPRAAEPHAVEPGAKTPPTAASLVAELRGLAAAHLRCTHALLAAYERLLTRLEPSAAASAVREFRVSAGPFADTAALRGFERTLAGIPEVREVAVRGYEGEDRAIVDVQLFGPKT
jgi:hypothetical protein